MVVGHNPGLEQLVSILSGESLHFPTAAIACFTFEISSWRDLKKSEGKLISLWRPKEVL
jgi:phosphohistidine phosphatase